MRLAGYCLMMSHNERCYAYQDSKVEMDRFLALKMYMVFTKFNKWPTQGQLIALTKVYQDLFKRSEIDGKLTCMKRIHKFKFEHSLYMSNLNLIGLVNQIPPDELAVRLTNRAIY